MVLLLLLLVLLKCNRENGLVYDFDANIMTYCLENYLEKRIFKTIGKVCMADFLQELWLCCCSVLFFVSLCSCSLPKNTHLLFLIYMCSIIIENI